MASWTPEVRRNYFIKLEHWTPLFSLSRGGGEGGRGGHGQDKTGPRTAGNAWLGN